ncbi:MAG: cyaA 2, partial [Gammaproteobacteria bacterium]|nr:cyaA 2 [Gammaproteobacteria bacterium]
TMSGLSAVIGLPLITWLIITQGWRMTVVIDKHGGVVDKYIGDAIMALFGAPLAMSDHASRAVACALEMISELEKNNVIFREKGWPELAMGVGIHTGKVVVGNMGSKDRLNYTAIGDGVNLAARLESVTKDFAVPIVISEATMRQAPGFQYRELDVIRVKGKQEAVKIFTPVAAKPPTV